MARERARAADVAADGVRADAGAGSAREDDVRTADVRPRVARAGVPILHEPSRRFGRNRRLALAGIVAAALLLVGVAVAGHALTGVATTTDFTAKNLAPSLGASGAPAHPFGTDWMGRDMLARTLAGLSTSVFVGLLAAACSTVIALVLATISALGGRAADAVVSWLIDLVMGVPHIVLLILVSYALGRGFWGVTIAVALTHWPSLTRVLRAEILQVRERPFMQMARAAGVSRLRLAARHMVPYVLPQLLVGLVLMFPHAILHEASITFLGFGLSPDSPAIGVILSESMQYLSAGYWWLAAFPGLALLVVVLAFDRLGALLRGLIDARSAQA